MNPSPMNQSTADYDDGYVNQWQYNQQFNPESVNLPVAYGSIIKELTDTEELLKKFELRLRGKIEKEGKIIDDPSGNSYIKTDRAARDFIDLIKGTVNRHTDFSYYEENYVYQIINGINFTINRWLMFQGDEVPLRYRFKISFEAMNLCAASLHKAMNGRILVWTKGTFREGMNITHAPSGRISLLDKILPWRKKKPMM